MDEYISREATAKASCEKCRGYYDGHCVHSGECDIDVIQTALAADVQPIDRWIDAQKNPPPIIDRRSMTSKSVLILRDNGRCSVAYYCNSAEDGDYWTTDDDKTMYCWEEVTHWQPLPELPKRGGLKMTIDEPIRSNTVTSDFEKFKKFFELMGIKYEIPADNLIYLSGFEVNSSQLIVIKFYEDGGFQEFCPYPEAFTHTEWLTELKNLRKENKNWKEAKRLLKLAVEDLSNTAAEAYNGRVICKCCKWLTETVYCKCPNDGGCDITYQWRYADEALKLIGDESSGV